MEPSGRLIWEQQSTEKLKEPRRREHGEGSNYSTGPSESDFKLLVCMFAAQRTNSKQSNCPKFFS